MLRGFFSPPLPLRGTGALPFLVPDAVGLFGPDAGLFGYHTALDAYALAVMVTGVTGADETEYLR